jgi:pSer/pThr/pTyr-binding forkhead associated (FHA) protein
MTARLVGWMPSIGRLNAVVRESARVGATPDNDVVVRVDGVSRTHAALTQQPDGYYIEDKGSKNGTWLNGERITRARLRHLDVVTLGRFAEVVFLERDADVPEPPPPPLEESLRAQLEWLDGPARGAMLDLPRGEIIIGRAESCGIVVESDSVSRAHVRLTVSDEGVTVEDLGTVNGTSVDDEPLTGAMSLASGAEVSVGQARRFRLILKGTPARPTGQTAAATPLGAQDMEWATRLVWSAKDLEALKKEAGALKSGSRAAAKPVPVTPRATAPKPAPPAPAAVAPPPPAPPSASPPTEPLPGKETVLARTDHTVLVPQALGTPPPAVRPAADADAGVGDRTRFDPAASVKLPQQFHDDAPTSLGLGAPEDLPTSLGERDRETAVTPRTSLDPPTVLERVAGADDQTSLPGLTTAAGVRTEMGGSPFDLPANADINPEDLPTSLGDLPGDAATHMPSNVFNPRDRTNLPPETVLGFRDVGPGARGTGSSGGTHLSPRAGENVPSAIVPAAPSPTADSLSAIESIKLTGDLGTYVIPRGTATVGRSGEATIRIDSREMSRIHAILSVTEREVIVEDRGSINGTSVNGTAISGRRTLVHGDRVCFADFEFRLEVKRTEGQP